MIIETHQSGECRVPARLINTRDGFGSVAVPVFSLIALHPREGSVLIDAGYHPSFLAATRPFPARLYRWVTQMKSGSNRTVHARVIDPAAPVADPSHIVLTHGHADHIAGALPFKNSLLWMSDDTMALIRAHRKTSLRSLARGFIPELLPRDVVERGRILDFKRMDWKYREHLPLGFDLFGDGSIVVVPLPGHAPGHCGVMLESENEGAVFYLADAVWDIRAITEHARSSRLATWLHETKPYQKTISDLRALLSAFPNIIPLPCHCARSAERLGARAAKEDIS